MLRLLDRQLGAQISSTQERLTKSRLLQLRSLKKAATCRLVSGTQERIAANRYAYLLNLPIVLTTAAPNVSTRQSTTCSDILVPSSCWVPVSYTHLRAHETRHDLVCRLLLE